MTEFLTLSQGDLQLELCPSIGGCVTRFSKGEIPLFRPYDPALPISPLNFASFPLTPFSNRIAYGQLRFRGENFSVGPKFASEAHPNHGDGWTSPWEVEDITSSGATLSLKVERSDRTPYAYSALQRFDLDSSALTITMEITNHSGRALPFGFGHHPYFVRDDRTILKLNAPRVWTSRNMVPETEIPVPPLWDFSGGRALSPGNLEPAAHGADGTAYIDHCFTGWDRRGEITWPKQRTKLLITADPVFENFVIYIPSNGDFFCAEPVTNVTDGFNLMEKGIANTGSIILEDGETASGSMLFEVQAA